MPTQANNNNQLLKNILTLIHEQRNTIKELQKQIVDIKKKLDDEGFIKVDQVEDESTGWRIW